MTDKLLILNINKVHSSVSGTNPYMYTDINRDIWTNNKAVYVKTVNGFSHVSRKLCNSYC
jgi:hypothetical protein